MEGNEIDNLINNINNYNINQKKNIPSKKLSKTDHLENIYNGSIKSIQIGTAIQLGYDLAYGHKLSLKEWFNNSG